MTWGFATGPWQGLPTNDLSEATARTVTWRLFGNSEATFTLPGDSAQAEGIREMIWDLWVLHNGRALFRGRIGPSNDVLDPDSTLPVTFSAADYRALMHRQILYEGDTLSYLSVDQSAIAWGLISSVQGKTGGNLGIRRGAGQSTGVIRVRSDYPAGTSVGGALDLLSQVLDGFDYDFTPNITTPTMTFDLFYPSRGTDRGKILDYGGRIATATRSVDPSTFGNAVRATGATGLAAVRAEASGLGSDPAGRWDLQYADPSISIAATLTAKAQQTLATGQYVVPSWTATFKPGEWGGYGDVWLGDQVTLVVKAGRLNVVQSLRVMEIALALDENDVDTVTLTLGAPNPKWARTARHVNRRLAALERR